MTVLSRRDTSFGTYIQSGADEVTSVHEFATAQPTRAGRMICADFYYLRKNDTRFLAH
jgi:hypothetical protein